MKQRKEDCGCVMLVDGAGHQRWGTMCKTHKAEFDACVTTPPPKITIYRINGVEQKLGDES